VIDDLKVALVTSGSALRAQSTRLRVVSENMANANVTSSQPGGDPYVRKTVSFASELDRATGANLVRINAIGRDKAPFQTNYDPGHPSADASGYVKMSNVNPLIEMSDMREAHRSYEASLQVVRQAREMIGDLIDLLRGK
jgi:flagellar basal-body rod protein FlgC